MAYETSPFLNFSTPATSGYPGGYSGGNPANRGFAPQTSVSTGAGNIADMVINMLLYSITQKMGGIASMGRPQVSDYANRMMKSRDLEAYTMMSGIYGTSPSNKKFGALGNNAIAQQFGDMFFQSGGSRGEAFKQVYGRFGSQFGGTNEAGLKEAGEKAANVITNMDTQFTDQKSGKWDYSKTSGFNRKNTINAVAEFTSQFGGKEVMDQMAEKPNIDGSNKGKIEEAGKQMSEITGAVREAGNFFGPNMPFDQLVQEMSNFADRAKGIKVGDIKNSLQDVQAMAQMVDMSNEAFSNYMKVVGEINKSNGGLLNTKDLAMESMLVGKASEDLGRKRAKDKGEIYTGKSKEEISMDAAKFKTDRATSQDSINSGIVAAGLDGDNSKEAEEIKQLRSQGKFGQALSRYNELASQGHFKDSQAEIAKNQSLTASGVLKWDKFNEAGVQKGREKEYKKSQEDGQTMKQTISDILDRTFKDKSNLEEIGGEKNAQTLKELVLGGKLGTTKEGVLDIAENTRVLQQSGMTQKQARAAANLWRNRAERRLGTGWELAVGELDPEKAKEHKIDREKQESIDKDMKAMEKANHLEYSDKGLMERGVDTITDVMQDLQKDGGELTVEKITKALTARGMENLAANPKNIKLQLERRKKTQRVDASRKRIYEENGITDKTPEGDETRKWADQKAIDENYDPNSIDGLMAKKMQDRQILIKAKMKDSGYEEGTKKYKDREAELQDEAQKEIEQEAVGAPKDDKNKNGKEDTSEKANSDKDKMTGELITAMKNNATTISNLVASLGTWAEKLQEDIKNRAPGS